MSIKKIEVIVGPMFSGKSEELIRRVTRETIANHNVVVFKPKRDDRYATDFVVSHNDKRIPCRTLEYPSDILDYDYESIDTVAIDEVQFFDKGIIPHIVRLNRQYNVRFVISGLDKDFLGEPFYVSSQLMSIAHRVDKLTAICSICGEEATESFYNSFLSDSMDRVEGNPVVVGGKEKYDARCRDHHVYTEDK